MPTLRETIDADIKQAMLKKDELTRETLRTAKSDMMLREVELGRPLNDEEAIAVLQRGVKTRKETIAELQGGGRPADREEQEIGVLQRYLPAAMDENDTRAAIAAVIAELKLTSKKDMGRLMKELKAKHPGVDGKLASKIAGEVLT